MLRSRREEFSSSKAMIRAGTSFSRGESGNGSPSMKIDDIIVDNSQDNIGRRVKVVR
eukprot:IDg5548t1